VVLELSDPAGHICLSSHDCRHVACTPNFSQQVNQYAHVLVAAVLANLLKSRR